VKDIVSTAIQRARLAKYRDSIASAMQAQFGNILHEVNFHSEAVLFSLLSKMSTFMSLTPLLICFVLCND